MWIDIVFIIILITGLVKGAMQGIVMAFFVFAGWVVGLVAALKFSAVVAGYLHSHTGISSRWLPLLAFLLVFLVVVVLVKLGGKAVESMVDLASLGWINRLGGALLFAGLYILLASVLLFYAEKMKLIDPGTLSASKCYSYTAGIAPALIEGIGSLIPSVKSTFSDLEAFFDKVRNSI